MTEGNNTRKLFWAGNWATRASVCLFLKKYYSYLAW